MHTPTLKSSWVNLTCIFTCHNKQRKQEKEVTKFSIEEQRMFFKSHNHLRVRLEVWVLMCDQLK